LRISPSFTGRLFIIIFFLLTVFLPERHFVVRSDQGERSVEKSSPRGPRLEDNDETDPTAGGYWSSSSTNAEIKLSA
jgi:hypothetical protein